MIKDDFINIIVAIDNDNGIGVNGDLPWNIPEDMRRFRNVSTWGEPLTVADMPKIQNSVIMGRVTWDSIPESFRPLKERTNWVVSRNPDYILESKEGQEKPTLVGSLEEALQGAKGLNSIPYVIGGESLYKEALSLGKPCRIYLTRVLGSYGCDRFFPDVLSEETLKHKSDTMKTKSGSYEFVFEKHEVV